MTWTTGLAIYFLIWWITLFAVLPFGIRSQHEGETVPGTDPGAPILPKLLWKVVWTTIVSSVLYGILYVVYVYRLIGLDDIPFLPRPLP
jgi:predicted secreted protein